MCVLVVGWFWWGGFVVVCGVVLVWLDLGVYFLGCGECDWCFVVDGDYFDWFWFGGVDFVLMVRWCGKVEYMDFMVFEIFFIGLLGFVSLVIVFVLVVVLCNFFCG